MDKKWDKRFMEMAHLVAGWSSCYKPNRQVGCVIAKNKRILTTGYNGAPSGIKNCKEKNCCMRVDLGIESGKQHELCYATHAEQNAIVQAAKMGISIEGATLYCTHQPCVICSKLIINSGISRIVFEHPYPDDFSKKVLDEAGVEMEQQKRS
ncbi:MAG: cytidine/deoxycytidylate deaminase family protein [Firmicutes bacterium]|nr:cytidine/deoxycytidylate deaminase family protein [Bacillota bacterium]